MDETTCDPSACVTATQTTRWRENEKRSLTMRQMRKEGKREKKYMKMKKKRKKRTMKMTINRKMMKIKLTRDMENLKK